VGATGRLPILRGNVFLDNAARPVAKHRCPTRRKRHCSSAHQKNSARKCHGNALVLIVERLDFDNCGNFSATVSLARGAISNPCIRTPGCGNLPKREPQIDYLASPEISALAFSSAAHTIQYTTGIHKKI
jgi:hypothetical protein